MLSCQPTYFPQGNWIESTSKVSCDGKKVWDKEVNSPNVDTQQPTKRSFAEMTGPLEADDPAKALKKGE